MTHLIVVHPEPKTKSCRLDGLTVPISYYQQKILLWLLAQQIKNPKKSPSIQLMDADKVLWPQEAVETPFDKLAAGDRLAKELQELSENFSNWLFRATHLKTFQLVKWNAEDTCYQLSPGITLVSTEALKAQRVDRPDKEEGD